MFTIRIRPAHVPAIVLAAAGRPAVSVGQGLAVPSARRGRGFALPSQPHVFVEERPESAAPSLDKGFPLAFVGESSPSAGSKLASATPTEKVAAAIFLLPFLAGPPVIGYMVLGTLGAVLGGLIAAPAIYGVASDLLGPSAPPMDAFQTPGTSAPAKS